MAFGADKISIARADSLDYTFYRINIYSSFLMIFSDLVPVRERTYKIRISIPQSMFAGAPSLAIVIFLLSALNYY
jgi:hypothetical protein